MPDFSNIEDLINTLARSKDLLAEMFGKRRSLAFRYDDALNLLEAGKLDSLISKGLLRQNGPYVELDDLFLSFFEQVLEVNEEINTSYINENISQIKQHINFYLQESNENRRYAYLKQVKSALRKIGRITLRNIIDLNRNVENAFKTEPNYSIKIARLEAFDEKRRVISSLSEQTDNLVTKEERTFFLSATDEELRQLVNILRQQLSEARHNLIETQKQIIDYLNQVKYQSSVIEKIKQVKYLKNQFELELKTNLIEILNKENAVLFEPKPAYSIKLSLDYLLSDEGYQSIQKVALKNKLAAAITTPVAERIASDYLDTQTEHEIFINVESLKNGFVASGTDLFSFILNYTYPRPVGMEEKVNIFCQMVGTFEAEFTVSENYRRDDRVEYSLVYPK